MGIIRRGPASEKWLPAPQKCGVKKIMEQALGEAKKGAVPKAFGI
jgi:hypothetical protein